MGKTPKSILTKEQTQFLELFGDEKKFSQRFYLTGGTALAEFYLQHRYSEDIDLFCEEEFDVTLVRPFVKKVQQKIGAQRVDYQNYFGLHTFLYSFPNGDSLKVDFNYYPFPRIEKGLRHHGVTVDSCYDIAVNKVHTIVMKPRSRDYIDIYFILQTFSYSFADLLKAAKIKFDWHIDAAQLGARLLQAIEVEDLPRMITTIDHEEWRNFFVAQAKKLEKDIFDS
ncbi:nucleotidyl transferase AbiEii/AbiGii toxin family protein [Candidatus Uhrbacteria bacterium]|nr:nucleotidyl transferase AbiEii/AbiGii toxin family protein [Candidatus Uhrbacteria bacterium]